MITLFSFKESPFFASLMLITILFIISCIIVVNNPPASKSITKIALKLPEKSLTPEDSTLKVITHEEDIARIVEFTDNQILKSDWKAEGLVDGFIQLFFYEGEVLVRDFSFSGMFISTSSHRSRQRRISEEEKKELLRLIGITQEEYSVLWGKQFHSGPWKQAK